MKLTINEVIQRINQVLNYPSVSYEDVYHFFDHALAELNTILKTAIPSVSSMLTEYKHRTTANGSTVILSGTPSNAASDPTTVPCFDSAPTEAPTNGINYACARDTGTFYVYNVSTNSWNSVQALYGTNPVVIPVVTYKAYYDSNTTSAVWVMLTSEYADELDLCEYMTEDWWTLFVIPYVCFKFAVRDGDDGALYSTEFTQGLQQLQTSYDVPNSVVLSTVADLPAYREIVLENIDKLDCKVITRAITDRMRVGNAVPAIFGNMYDTGGWGI